MLYCKKFNCNEKKNALGCDRRNLYDCNPNNDFDRDFFVWALCITLILKLHPLFIFAVYISSKALLFPVQAL